MNYDLNSPEARAVKALELDAYEARVRTEMEAYRPWAKLPPKPEPNRWYDHFHSCQRLLREMHPHAADHVIQRLAYEMARDVEGN